jgi:hypothetical protein
MKLWTWKGGSKMFDIHQSLYSEYGDRDEDKLGQYIDGLLEAFAESPEGAAFFQEYGDVGWAGHMMHYYFDYIGGALPEMTARDLQKVLFELFPRKVSTEPESAAEIIAEVRAFWTFVKRQYGLKNADKLLAVLDAGAADRLRQELANPANYGMAKSFFMMGQKAGIDMTTQEGLDQFQTVYNASLQGGVGPMGPPLPPLDDDFDDIDVPSLPPVITPKQRAANRKKHKAQRQARKRDRKHK